MRVQRSRHAANFTVLPNPVIRDRRLSFTARGILAHLLSLPDGAREDVRTLADNNHGVGRQGVSKAVQELEDAGYYVRKNVRDPETGRVRTETFVYDTPQGAEAPEVSPLPASPGTGTPAAGNTGANPKNLVSKTPENLPPVVVKAEESARAERAGEIQPEGEATPDETEAARILGRLEAVDARLTLSQGQVRKLVPAVVQWLRNGACAAHVIETVTAGLPETIHAPARLLANRLERKVPAPVRRGPVQALCGKCSRLLPAGMSSGICAVCAGLVPASPAPAPVPTWDPTLPDGHGLAAFRAARAALRPATA